MVARRHRDRWVKRDAQTLRGIVELRVAEKGKQTEGVTNRGGGCGISCRLGVGGW